MQAYCGQTQEISIVLNQYRSHFLSSHVTDLVQEKRELKKKKLEHEIEIATSSVQQLVRHAARWGDGAVVTDMAKRVTL